MVDLTSSLSMLTDNPAMAIVNDLYTSFSERRAMLNLPNPGTVDNIAREVQKEVLLSNFMFTGLRADLTKVFGMSPLFRVSHAFSMGSSGNLPPYAFSSMYGSPKVRKLHFPHLHETSMLSPGSMTDVPRFPFAGLHARQPR